MCGRRHRGEAAREIGQEIFDGLEADVKAHSRPARLPARRRTHRRAVEGNGKAFVAAPGGADAEQLKRIEKHEYRRLRHRLEHDAEKPRCAGEIALPQYVTRMAVQRRVEEMRYFRPGSYGFRPKRGARQAIYDIRKWVTYGYDKVIDLDLKSYFDTIDHDLLMKLVQRRVRDARVLRLLRCWLRAGVMLEGTVTDNWP